MRSECVAEAMAGGVLADSGTNYGIANRSLDRLILDRVSPQSTRVPVWS